MSFENKVSSSYGTTAGFSLNKVETKKDSIQSTGINGLKFKENPHMGLTIEKAAGLPKYDTPKQLGAVREKRIEASMGQFETMFEAKKAAIQALYANEFHKQISEEALNALALTQMNK